MFLMFKSYELCLTFKTPTSFLICHNLISMSGFCFCFCFFPQHEFISSILLFYFTTWISTSSNKSQFIFRSLVQFHLAGSVLHVFHFPFFTSMRHRIRYSHCRVVFAYLHRRMC